MKKKLNFLIPLLLVFMMILTSCTAAADLMDGIESQYDRVPEPMSQELNLAMLNFTWDLFKESSKNTGNIMISPPSIILL